MILFACLFHQVICIETLDKINFNLTLRTDATAAFVWLEAVNIPGKFSENGFMFVTSTKSIKFLAESKTSMAKVLDSLIARSIGSVPQFVAKSKIFFCKTSKLNKVNSKVAEKNRKIAEEKTKVVEEKTNIVEE